MSKKTKKRTDAQLIDAMFSSLLGARKAFDRLKKQNPEIALYVALSVLETEFGEMSQICGEFKDTRFGDVDDNENDDAE